MTLVLYADRGGRSDIAVRTRAAAGLLPVRGFQGFGSYLSELYPTRARGAGQGSTYTLWRGIGAFFPALIGILSAAIGLAAAILFGAAAYGLCLIARLFLPETRGKQFELVE